MLKPLKIIACALAVLFGLLAAVTIALRVLYPPAKLRHLLEVQIQNQLHREIQLGDVKLSLRGLTLDRFKLSEVPAFSAGTFLSVEELRVRWAWIPLLSKLVVINEISLEKPQIELIRMADGKTLNISDLTSPPSPARSTGEGKSEGKAVPTSRPSPIQRTGESVKSTSAWSWRVREIHLRHGVISFDDRSPARQTSTLSDIELILRDFDPSRVQGQVNIGQLQNPVYTAKDFSVEWALYGIDPSLGHLNGWMRLKQDVGLIQNLTDLVNSSPGAKLALLPLVMLQNVDRLGFVRLGLPDFSHLPITRIMSDYTFKEGVMKINTFEIISPQLTIGALGDIDLARGPLSVDVAMNTPQPVLLGAMNLKMHISGTLSDPKTDLNSLKKKAFKATINTLIQHPDDLKKNVNDALKSIFH